MTLRVLTVVLLMIVSATAGFFVPGFYSFPTGSNLGINSPTKIPIQTLDPNRL